jgi:hypothetical protein
MNDEQMKAYQEMKDYYNPPWQKELSLANSQLADLWIEKRELERALRDATIALLKITQENPPGELIMSITVPTVWSGWHYAKFIAKGAFSDWERRPLFVKAIEAEFESGLALATEQQPGGG